VKLLAAFAAGLVLFASGFLVACGSSGTANPPKSSPEGTPTTIVLSGSLTLIESETTR